MIKNQLFLRCFPFRIMMKSRSLPLIRVITHKKSAVLLSSTDNKRNKALFMKLNRNFNVKDRQTSCKITANPEV